MARRFPVENLPPQNVGSIINYLQCPLNQIYLLDCIQVNIGTCLLFYDNNFVCLKINVEIEFLFDFSNAPLIKNAFVF